MNPVVVKIISGGQTGADRAALEAAKILNIKTGGYCPQNYKTEAGYDVSLKHFGLKQAHTNEYSERTVLNIKNSDGTIIFGKIIYRGRIISPGTLLTLNKVNEFHKPYLLNPTKRQFIKWLEKNNIKILNVAGNRLSEDPYIYKTVLNFLLKSFEDNELTKFRNSVYKIRTDNTIGSKALLKKLITAIIKYLKNTKDNRAKAFVNVLKETETFTKGKNSEMVLLYKFVKDFKRKIQYNTKTDALKYLTNLSHNLKADTYRLNRSAINNIDFKNKTVLLISNSSSITSLFKEIKRREIPVKIIQCKSYPGKEGVIQSTVLKSYGLKVRLINDNEVKSYLPKTDFALFGCDAYNKKYFLNKSGSFKISKLFYSKNKPVYVLADKDKYSAGFHRKQNLSGMFDTVPLSYVRKIVITD